MRASDQVSRTVNLGILAHVDAGKTTLTEQLLHSAGVIAEVGRVDDGTTQTDSLALERERGITIKAAVVSFSLDDVTVNLVDTPGHPDFIAEVERVLDVLDGAVLVVSAVEGVQPQTRVLMRALERLGTPTLVFVNKIDRAGADERRVLMDLGEQLGLDVVTMTTTRDMATRAACVDSLPLDEDRLIEPTRRAQLHPVFFGSAMTGAGVEQLCRGIRRFLPVDAGDPRAPLQATVFKIERGSAGEKVAYVSVRAGTLHVRDRFQLGDGPREAVTSLGVFQSGGVVVRPSVGAGQIARVSGLRTVRIGDQLGAGAERASRPQFPPPALATAIIARDASDSARLVSALDDLAEQDPLINVRRSEDDALTVSIYGEVQKEVLEATLASEYGIAVDFRETTVVYVERPVRRGHAVERLIDDANPISATVGLRVEPALPGAGVEVHIEVDTPELPLHIYKDATRFHEAMRTYVSDALHHGLHGWQVTDCVVTLDACEYYASDGPRKPTTPTTRTTAADFRKLTPIVLRTALRRAGTIVCEPMLEVRLEVPTDTLGAVLGAIAQHGGVVDATTVRARLTVIGVTLPAAAVQALTRRLPELSHGEGVIESRLVGHRPVRDRAPTRGAR